MRHPPQKEHFSLAWASYPYIPYHQLSLGPALPLILSLAFITTLSVDLMIGLGLRRLGLGLGLAYD